MPLFAIQCTDAPRAAELRQTYLAAHLRYAEEVADRIAVGGPLRDGAGRFSGSLLVVTAEDEASARALIEADPYAQAGVWGRIDVSAFSAVIGEWVGGVTWPSSLSRDQQD